MLSKDSTTPGNPIVGTLSADGTTIDWGENETRMKTVSRTDVDECAADTGILT